VKQKRERIYYTDDEALKLIGARIREFRTKKGISQESLAIDCELDYSQINRIELGKVNFGIALIYRIALELEVDVKDLM
jgi:transcriptional regulator with XRE-family HTH domain